ncbi:MAG: hypothetical protein ACRDN6_11640 [Gaiellaceae bacterium]
MPAAGLRATLSRPVDPGRLLRMLEWTTLAAAVGFYSIFIARTAFRVGGERYFTLFDDAMISMRYARNLADGHGLVWNPGEQPVEGYTNFLWTLWMVFVHLLGLPESKIALAVMISGVLLLVGNVLLVRRIAERLAPGRPWIRLLALVLVAFYYPLVYWTLRGTEVGLLAFLTSAGILLTLRLREDPRRRDVALLAAVLALGLLTRTDFAVTALVLVAFVAARRRVAAVLLGTIVATIAAHTVLRLALYGDLLPNTYYLKVEGVSLGTRLARGARALEVVELAHLFAPTLLAAGFLLARKRRKNLVAQSHKVPGGGAWLLAGVFLAQCAYSLYVGGDAWEYMEYSNRYLAQAMPGLLVLAALGLAAAVGGRSRRLAAALAASFGLVGLTLVLLKAPIDRLQPNVTATYEPKAIVLALVLVFAALAAPRVPRLRRAHALGAAVAAALLVAALNTHALAVWTVQGGVFVADDALISRYGLALRRATTEDASIAVVQAGSIPYFSHRRSIDLLGKSDALVAHSEPQLPIFYPGHTKWDYRHSIVRLKPDVIAQTWYMHSRDRPIFDRYDSIGWIKQAFVDPDSTRVDRDRLRLFLLDDERWLTGA